MARERRWMRPCHLRLAESGRQWQLPGTSDVEACSAVIKHEWTAEVCPSCSDLVQISNFEGFLALMPVHAGIPALMA